MVKRSETPGRLSSRLLTAAAAAAIILAAPGAFAKSGSGSGGDDIDDKIDDKIDRQVEDKVDDRLDRKVDDKVDDKLDGRVDSKVDDKLGEDIDDKVEERSGRDREDRTEDLASDKAADSAADRAADALEAQAKAVFDRERDAADFAHRAAIDAAKEKFDKARRLDGADIDALKAEFEAAKDAADADFDTKKDALKADLDAAKDAADAIEDAEDHVDRGDDAAAPVKRLFEAELDENGDRRTRGEWLMLVDAGEAKALAARGYRLEAVEELPSLGAVLMRASISVAGDIGAAEAAVRRDAPAADIDYNHLYVYHPASAAPSPRGVAPRAAMKIGAGETGRGLKIGVIDTRVDAAHEALLGAALTVSDFVPYAAPRPGDHGTSVVSIIAGRSASFEGLAPDAEIYEASVFFAAPDGAVSATTESIVKAIDWLAAQNVSVINLSLAGPPNEILKGAVARANERGIAIVAAVGNEGPAARPLYPAAYEGVIGVTAVARDKRVYRLANRGGQVDFAAPGVDVLHADERGGYSAASGTSFAAPFVTAVVAAAGRDGRLDAAALKKLEESAEDLGETGRDPVYGAGLIRSLSE
jgi:subtilisin family serine protease